MDKARESLEKFNKTIEYVRHNGMRFTIAELLDMGYCFSEEDVDNISQVIDDSDSIKKIFDDYNLGEYKLTSIREALLLLKQYQGEYGLRGQKLISNKLNVLEILKKKRVDCFEEVCEVHNYYEYCDYMSCYKPEKELLTKTEFDLIKEVLNEDSNQRKATKSK